MATPGTTVNVTTATTPNNPPSSTGTLFAVGQTQRGPVGAAINLSSLAQYIALCGPRTFNGATPTLYDAIDVFFQEGGQQAYLSRVSGVNAAAGSLILKDRAVTPLNTLTVSALGPGTWGNAITVAVSNGTVANSYVLTIVNGSVTEESPNLFSPTDAVNWAASYSATVTIANNGSATAAPNNNPAVLAATALAGGLDDTAPTDTVWTTALAVFGSELGPGQVAAPGRITPVVWEGLITHGQSFNRFALLDGENVATASTIEADAGTVQGAVTDASYGMMLAPWVIYNGPPTGSATPAYPRTVAPSALVAGLMARSDASGNNADVAAAGNNGISRTAANVTQTYSASDRGSLDAAGVGVIRNYRGDIQLYGYTSLSADPNWSDVGNVRLRMQIIDGVHLIGDQFAFADIDAQGQLAAAFGGQITAFLNTLYDQGALFGATPAAAFFVNVGPSVNTPATAAARQLVAQIGIRMSPTADLVVINITRYPVNQSLPSSAV